MTGTYALMVALAGGLMLAAFFAFLHERGVFVFSRLIGFFRRPILEVLLASFFVVGLIHIGATKERGHRSPGARSHLFLPSSLSVSPTIPPLVRAAHLAQGIPALTPPTGNRNIGAAFVASCSYNLNIDANNEEEEENGVLKPNGWSIRSRYGTRWLHSDMKDVAYFYNFMFYELVVEKGVLR